ncbi:hypothetical protein [Pyxidicoccus xibeiensis]|uniref:hypothetical protein n=1 Tax=Pyxidicoccus xibeiensis TaxID=2906759 RepID=UPI0020A6E0C5|nr:hypothetical protein [Pyxidicoccus xibeiensis]MCP3136379.1 hypothetical protein [Pyxidicoccus xibeiensis]
MGTHRRRATLLGWLVFGLCGATAVVRAATSDVRPPQRRLSDAERAQVGLAAAAEEPARRRASRHSFPGDHWSQDDDFGASERRWAVDEAHRRGVPVTDVLGAIDAELHSSAPVVPPRKATASPCKPRPFYD